jgi:hypothetical protein
VTTVDLPPAKKSDYQNEPIPVRQTGDDETKCHCQGGRLVLLIGNFDKYTNDQLNEPHPTDGDPNETRREYLDSVAAASEPSLRPYKYYKDPVIAAVGDWLSKQIDPTKMHVHIFGYSTSAGEPDMQDPYEPQGVGTPKKWKKRNVPKATMEKARSDGGLLPKDCCYFDEVIIIFHGDTDGVYKQLKDYLPRILGGRPVKQLVLWSCKSTNKFYPDAQDDDNHNYREICWIVRPIACRCGCTMAACNAINADLRTGKKCPFKDDRVTVITSGWTVLHGGKVEPHSVSLDPGGAKPFTSPGAVVRKITIEPGTNEISAELVTDATVFGKPVGNGGTKSGEMDGKKLTPKIAPVAQESGQFKYDGGYSGPDGTNICPNQDGCLKPAM